MFLEDQARNNKYIYFPIKFLKVHIINKTKGQDSYPFIVLSVVRVDYSRVEGIPPVGGEHHEHYGSTVSLEYPMVQETLNISHVGALLALVGEKGQFQKGGSANYKNSL